MRLLSQQPAAQDFRQSNITFQHRVLRTTAALTLLPLLHPPFAPRAAVLWRGRNFAGFLVVKTLSALGRVLRVGSTPAWRCWGAPSVRWCTWWCTSGFVFWWVAVPAGCRRGAGSCAACGVHQPASSSAASPSHWPSSCAGRTSAPWCPWAVEPARGWAGRQGRSPPGCSPPSCHRCRRGSPLLLGRGTRSRIRRRVSGTNCVEMRQGSARKTRQCFSSPRTISSQSALNPKRLPCLPTSRAISPCWRSAWETQRLPPASKGWSRRLPRAFYDGGKKVTEWEREFGERSSKERYKC